MINQKYLKIIFAALAILLLLVIVYVFQSMQDKEVKERPALRELAHKEGFYIGAAVNADYLDKDGLYRKTLDREVNMVTAENEMKFDVIHPEKYRYDFSKADKIVDFALKNRQKVRGHTLVWFHRIPEWLKKGRFSRDEMKLILKNHIQTVVGRYRGQVYAWDVVNEALNEDGSLRDSIWLRTIGPEYIPLAFKWAHEADPNALLFYNDYGIEGMNPKSNALYERLKQYKMNHVPIDGVGYQMHSWINRAIDFHDLKKSIDRLGGLGLQVQVTELDIGTAEPVQSSQSAKAKKQADYYAGALRTCLSSKACTAFVMWGITDKYTFRNKVEKPLIFDGTYKPKKSYWALFSTLENKKIEK
ncbi:endo-1,4-beta-xylanase [Sporolactobacillus sp. THM7-7]|nr:endo-1,4-beta-xylanase [Sporolactobacillus sp. THM7-7]